VRPSNLTRGRNPYLAIHIFKRVYRGLCKHPCMKLVWHQPTPLSFNKAPLSFCSREYHQPPILRNSSPSTAKTINSRRCPDTPSRIIQTASIPRILILLMCRTTTLLPTIGLNSCPGYHPWIRAYGIGTSKSAVSRMLGNG